MRKRKITSGSQNIGPSDQGWLDMGRAAVVEVTSEENGYPIESALVAEGTPGWRAALAGLRQSI